MKLSSSPDLFLRQTAKRSPCFSSVFAADGVFVLTIHVRHPVLFYWRSALNEAWIGLKMFSFPFRLHLIIITFIMDIKCFFIASSSVWGGLLCHQQKHADREKLYYEQKENCFRSFAKAQILVVKQVGFKNVLFDNVVSNEPVFCFWFMTFLFSSHDIHSQCAINIFWICKICYTRKYMKYNTEHHVFSDRLHS